jgi:hypothetical protein
MNKITELVERLKRSRRASILARGVGYKSRIQELKVKGTKLRFAVLEGDTADQIQRKYEEEVYVYIMKIPRGAVFFDLGASIGNFSLFSAARGLKTYAFEPDPKNFEALELNRRANGFAFFKGAVKTLADPKLKGFIIELYKDSPFYRRILQTLADANFELEAEFQITSAGQLEPGLFNMEYVRRERDDETYN